MTNIYYQPDFKQDDTLMTPDGKVLSSFHVYSDLGVAKKDFPDRPIMAYSGDDIEDPEFVDLELMNHPQYASCDDRKISRLLIDTIFDLGYGVSVEDEEDVVMKASISGKYTTLDYLKKMAGTGIDIIKIWDLTTKLSIGWFYLIYNDSCGDPMELINDYSNNDVSNIIYKQVERQV